MDWEKILANYISDKRLIPKIYSNLHINKKKDGHWRQFPNEKIQMANKHEKMSNFVSSQENTK